MIFSKKLVRHAALVVVRTSGSVDIGAIDDLEAIAAQVPYDTACIVMPSAAADVCASKLTPFHPADSHVSRKAI